MQDVNYYRDSEEWVRSMGMGVLKIHYREMEGTGHAVCDRDTGDCSVHYDAFNPHSDFFAHIWKDSPEVIWRMGVMGAVSLVLPSFFTAIRRRFF